MIRGFSRHHHGRSKIVSWVKGNVCLGKNLAWISIWDATWCDHKNDVWCKSYGSLDRSQRHCKRHHWLCMSSSCKLGFYGNGKQPISRMSVKFPCCPGQTTTAPRPDTILDFTIIEKNQTKHAKTKILNLLPTWFLSCFPSGLLSREARLTTERRLTS